MLFLFRLLPFSNRKSVQYDISNNSPFALWAALNSRSLAPLSKIHKSVVFSDKMK